MLRTVSELQGRAIAASDGEIGSVEDVYFDDVGWTVRYLVVDTGHWLPGRTVLISPMAIRKAGGVDGAIPVALTKAQVERSPSVDTDLPVNRQYELEYSRYYGYPFYWSGPYRWGSVRYPDDLTATGPGPVPAVGAAPPAPAVRDTMESGGDPHLRSARDVTGYYIEATDGDIGHVEDLLVDDREWAIRYMIVDTRNWWPGKKVLLSPDWIARVSWQDSRVHVDLTRDGIKSAPEYDPTRPIEREYESSLYGHHARRSYWDE
jgi:sporulation protein YlmC with PRC-barrel domain